MFSIRHTDRWGKERCVVIGGCVIVPAALVAALGAEHLWVMLPAFGVFLMGFELAIISALPLGAELTPHRPAVGLARLIGAATVARAIVAVPATAWSDGHGFELPAIGSAVLGLVAVAAITVRRRLTT